MSSNKFLSNSLTPFEWMIMNRIWSLGSGTVRQISESLPEDHQRAYTTIQTYLERLVEKTFLRKTKVGLVNVYSPVTEKDAIVNNETNRFVDRVFDGSVTRLAAFLINHKKLSPAELEQIRKLIEDENPDG